MKVKFEEEIRQIFLTESQAIMNIPVSCHYAEAVDLIYDRVHNRKGKLITSGLGKAGEIAHSIATLFSSTGTPSVFLHPSEAQHGDLGVLQVNDVLLIVSNSGETREVIELLDLAERLYPEMPEILICGNEHSRLGKRSSICISTGHPEEVCPLGLAPTTSTTVMAAIGDALVVLMMKKTGFTKEEYAKRHHGGYIGYKLRNGETDTDSGTVRG
jgi:arabinose-5-phosphate isomerase